MLFSKEKEDPEVPNIDKRRNMWLEERLLHPILKPKHIIFNLYIIYIF